jgi:hypothetical protein
MLHCTSQRRLDEVHRGPWRRADKARSPDVEPVTTNGALGVRLTAAVPDAKNAIERVVTLP